MERTRRVIVSRIRVGSRTRRERWRAVRFFQLSRDVDFVDMDSESVDRFLSFVRGAVADFGGGGKYGTRSEELARVAPCILWSCIMYKQQKKTAVRPAQQVERIAMKNSKENRTPEQ